MILEWENLPNYRIFYCRFALISAVKVRLNIELL